MASWRETELPKRVAGVALFVVALASFVVGLLRESGVATTRGDRSAAAAQVEATMVYYFHGHQRCRTCNKIEAETRRVITTRFADEMAAGRLVFATLNFDLPENLHFRDDYELAFGTVLVRGRGVDPAWKNLEGVWDHVNGEAGVFDDYLEDGIRSILEQAP